MRVLSESGGVTVTVVKHSMQRAPCSVSGTRAARDFGQWLVEQFQAIKGVAESTTRVGKLLDIEQYALGNLLYALQLHDGRRGRPEHDGQGAWAACRSIAAAALHPLGVDGHGQEAFGDQHAAHARRRA